MTLKEQLAIAARKLGQTIDSNPEVVIAALEKLSIESRVKVLRSFCPECGNRRFGDCDCRKGSTL